MRITLIDESVPFDGRSPATVPLGGPEKAFAELATALARADHQVVALNRVAEAVTVEGVDWRPLAEAVSSGPTDLLIALRKPRLLALVAEAGRRVLWCTGDAARLDRAANRNALARYRPHLAFLGPNQAERWRGRVDVPVSVIRPGVAKTFLDAGPLDPTCPPRAVVTSHPARGLDWLIKLWTGSLHPALPSARLEVYSAVLSGGLAGRPVPESLRPLLGAVLDAQDKGVVVRPPLGDTGMAEAFARARVHLYPGAPEDTFCYSLTETQACGLPAVARPLGAAGEVIVNGETGYLAPDDPAFVNLALMILRDDDCFAGLSTEARDRQRKRGWDEVAHLFATLVHDARSAA